jgi:Ca2+-binding RTX toxin-like protein
MAVKQPKPIDPDIPADTTSSATFEGISSGTGFSYSGSLEVPGDHDWIAFSATAGIPYTIYASLLDKLGRTSGDSVVAIRDSAGNVVNAGDDGGVGTNTLFVFTPATSGTYFVDIGDFGNNDAGEYSVFIRSNFDTSNVLRTDAPDVFTSGGTSTVLGGKGADTLIAGNFNFINLLGEQGNDILHGNDTANSLAGGVGNDTIYGNGDFDLIWGDMGSDDIAGGSGDDWIWGGRGADHIDGGIGSDQINGGRGADILYGGLDGDTDFFIFSNKADSLAGTQHDIVLGFDNDFINLLDVDANAKVAGDQAFRFIGSANFHKKPGELTVKIVDGSTMVLGDTNGDGKADFQIELTGIHALTAADFFL